MPISYRDGPQTNRLSHRAFEVADAEVFYKLSSDPDIMRYTGDKSLTSVGEAKRAIIDYPDFDRIGYGRWASVLRNTQQVVGFCGLKYLEDIGEVDIGYRFLPSHWGTGLATEASTACLEFGFRVIGLTRIVAFVIPENVASLRVLEKSGMKFESAVDYDGIAALRYAKESSM